MKKLLPVWYFLLAPAGLFSQTTLKFCVETSKTGSCINATNEFNISHDGGTITFMLRNEKGLGVNKLVYKVYSLTDDGNEIYNNTIEQQVEGKWNYAWEEAVFYDPGTYKVMVYDKSDNGNLICVGILKIFTQ